MTLQARGRGGGEAPYPEDRVAPLPQGQRTQRADRESHLGSLGSWLDVIESLPSRHEYPGLCDREQEPDMS